MVNFGLLMAETDWRV